MIVDRKRCQVKYRTYVDGKRTKTSGDYPLETVRHYLDNIQKEWSRNGLFPLTTSGEFDFNQANSVERVSPDELLVRTTANKLIRWVIVK